MNISTVEKSNEEIMLENLHRQVELTLSEAKKVLYKIDSEIDKLEGKDIHKAMLAVQDYLLDWNMLGHNFTILGIQDWLDPHELE